MKANRKILFAMAVLVSVLGNALPTYADVTRTSLKQVESRVIQKRVADTSCRKKGRNKKGSWKMQNAVLGGSNCSVPATTGSFKRPKMGGLRIDACIQMGSKSKPKLCNKQKLNKVGHSFCKSKGFDKSIHIVKESHNGKHAILTYKNNKPSNSYWKREKGRAAIKKIICK